jgi:hypothetical protein
VPFIPAVRTVFGLLGAEKPYCERQDIDKKPCNSGRRVSTARVLFTKSDRACREVTQRGVRLDHPRGEVIRTGRRMNGIRTHRHLLATGKALESTVKGRETTAVASKKDMK